MAGHSHAANIKHRKNAQDAKKAKLWTKALRAVFVAAKIGQDMVLNSSLRVAFEMARSIGVPKDKIEMAIQRAGSSDHSDNAEAIRYNANFHGIAIIIETLTDSRNRMINDLRTIFNKHGVNIVDNGGVEFMFENIGLIVLDASCAKFETVFEVAVNSGASDILEEDGHYYIECKKNDFGNVSSSLVENFRSIVSAEVIWKPKITVDADSEQMAKLEKILNLLDENDDIESVYHNAIPC